MYYVVKFICGARVCTAAFKERRVLEAWKHDLQRKGVIKVINIQKFTPEEGGEKAY